MLPLIRERLPEVLRVAYADQIETILREIVRAADLNDTGRGIAFVVPVDRVVGVAHFMKRVSDPG